MTPTTVERNYLDDLNPDSKRVITRVRRAGARTAAPEERVPVRARTAISSPISLDHARGSRCSIAR